MYFKKITKKIITSQKGTSIVLFIASCFLISTLGALTLDIGTVFLEKSKLSKAVDASTLAGAQEIVKDASNAHNVVKDYMQKNSESYKNISINIDLSIREIEVQATKQVDFSLARIIGKESKDITAIARAKIENIKTLTGLRPLGVIHQNFNFGQQYTLKEGAGDGYNGNYAGLALGGSGASNYRDNILYGYPGEISVGDLIETETGAIANPTKTAIDSLIYDCNHVPACTYNSYVYNCPKIIFIPVVDTLEINGKKYVEVLGFATFFLEGTVNSGGHTDVIGRFITYNTQGQTSDEINDYGTYGIRLIK